MTISITEFHLDARDIIALDDFLKAIVEQKRLPYADRRQDQARKRAKRWGLAYFDTRSRTWMITDAGREYVDALGGKACR